MIKFLFAVLIFTQLFACKHEDIKLEAMRATSDLIHVEVFYGLSSKKMFEQNEILIQTGYIDTTDEHPPKYAAIIKVNNKEVVLTLIKESGPENLYVEEYANEQYHLILKDSEKKEGNETVYKSECVITNGNLKSEYKLIGKSGLNL